MRFEIKERDGLARVGTLEIDGVLHETPAIAYAGSQPRPKGSLGLAMPGEAKPGELVVAKSGFSGETAGDAHLSPGFRGSKFAPPVPDGAFHVIADPAPLLLDSAAFADAVEKAKGPDSLMKPVYLSSAALPHRLALLAYCGIDVFDSLAISMATESGLYLTNSGILEHGKVKALPCSCPSCLSDRRGKQELLAHNQAAAEDELRHVRHAISEGRLRELVEARIRADPWLVQDLRLLDIGHYPLLEMHAPVKGAPFHAGSKESLARPEVRRWRARLEARYARPPSARVLLLIPCSAKKPYSMSKSHLRFRDALVASGAADVVHEVIVTSPLGLVPRELELAYPAQDYDIPVTGHWDRDEKRLAEEMVSWLVESQRYDAVISHLGDEREPVNSVLRDFTDTSGGNPGSKDALRRLEDELRQYAPDGPDTRHDRWAEDMRSRCRFQFGEAGEMLCEGAQVQGRYPNLRINRAGAQVGMLTGDRGLVSLTLDGGRLLAPSNAYTVEIEDFQLKGNLFAVGVSKAAPEIRIGDDVVIAHRGEVRGVGVARMCSAEMDLAERGEAVRVRHAK
ncbi:MAG: archaeosine synthase subunit alpha [Thermoplasmata archaeon]|nr:archaeosine synthase subunit alpha [Thermoplasmata archaeon]